MAARDHLVDKNLRRILPRQTGAIRINTKGKRLVLEVTDCGCVIPLDD